MKKLCIATCVSCVFICAELVGGWWAGSIAIMADAAHLSSDIIGFGVSIIALRLGQKGPNDHLTYGWNRAEIIGTMVSVATIWVMTVWLFIEATFRFFEEPQVTGSKMLIIAVIALMFNLIWFVRRRSTVPLSGSDLAGPAAICCGSGSASLVAGPDAARGSP